MKEEAFKFKKSYAEAIENMSDRQAGVFIKGMCRYAFLKQPFLSKEKSLQSTFVLVKKLLDEEKFYQEKGKEGAYAKVENEKQRLENKAQKNALDSIDDVLNKVVASLFRADENEDLESEKSVAKSKNFKAG